MSSHLALTATLPLPRALHKVVLGGMTPIELQHYFSGASDPIFHLVRPRLMPGNATQQVRLTIR